MRRAFTLIELLAVIAILAILFMILMPLGRSAQQVSRSSQCNSNLRQWAAYWALYCSDHQGQFMNGWINEGTYIGYHRGAWALELKKYYHEQTRLLFCPLATAPTVVGGKTVDYGGVNSTYKQGFTDVGINRGSYGLNSWCYDPPPYVDEIQRRDVEKHWRGFGGSGVPTRIPLFFDSMWRGCGPHYGNDNPDAITAPTYNGEWIGANAEMHHVAMDRHRGGVQIIYMDMSTRHTPVKKLWHLLWHKGYDPTVALSKVGGWPAWLKDYPEPTP